MSPPAASVGVSRSRRAMLAPPRLLGLRCSRPHACWFSSLARPRDARGIEAALDAPPWPERREASLRWNASHQGVRHIPARRKLPGGLADAAIKRSSGADANGAPRTGEPPSTGMQGPPPPSAFSSFTSSPRRGVKKRPPAQGGTAGRRFPGSAVSPRRPRCHPPTAWPPGSLWPARRT